MRCSSWGDIKAPDCPPRSGRLTFSVACAGKPDTRKEVITTKDEITKKDDFIFMMAYDRQEGAEFIYIVCAAYNYIIKNPISDIDFYCQQILAEGDDLAFRGNLAYKCKV